MVGLDVYLARAAARGRKNVICRTSSARVHALTKVVARQQPNVLERAHGGL